jgi:3-dehydroquinate synthase
VANIQVETASASYRVFIGQGLLESLLPRIHRALGRKPQRIFVLTSPIIWALWSKNFLSSFGREAPPTILFLPPGETKKNLRSVEVLVREMAAAGADRSSLLIAFGGGIVGDLGGFLAAIYMRGIDYVGVPTTLLSQVDSSVGGKTGVNLPEGKNLVGCFHHPRAVFADVLTLQTLSDRELRAGLFESIKAGIIRDARLFAYMEKNSSALLGRDPKALEHVIAASVRMKAAVVGEDERESGVRMILNLGHTLGHALESATRYRKFLHGESVGLGMIAALEIGRRRATVTDAQADRITCLIDQYGPFPYASLAPAQLIAASARDKKHSAGVHRFVLPVGIGDAAVVNDVTTEELTAAATAMLAKRKGC